ncbi:MAG: hypothetical protein PVG49_19515 [Desulfobacteraceae bacterium]|jgi:hypothetical protein
MKEKKGKRPKVFWILVLLILAVAAVTAYLVMTQENGSTPPQREESRETREPEPKRTTVERQAVPSESETSPQQEEEMSAEETVETSSEEGPLSPSTEAATEGTGEGEDVCAEIEADVRDFFEYLDGKEYIKRHAWDADTWSLFTHALGKLSLHPPIPAGEGLDPALMTMNIFHFFRTLDDRELLLAKEVLQHEADTLELNLELFYRWLTLGNRCPDPEGVRPTQNVLYNYAGFFMNTIGGRSYLFRRATRLRLLVSYYSVRILSDADQAGRNRYGIDVLPMTQKLREEIALQPDLLFRDTYLDRLSSIEVYYAARR